MLTTKHKNNNNSEKQGPEYEEQNEKRRRNQINIKNVFISGVLLAVLVWGSSFLILAVSNFQKSRISSSEFERFLKQNSPPLLTSSRLKPYQLTNDGKIPLNFSAVREGKFKPKYKQFQWIKEPESINNDKGTYVVKDESNNSTKYLIKSIVDNSYEYILYDDSSFEYDGKFYEIDNLIASPDLTKAILKTNTTQNWRHSSFALYWLFDKSNNSTRPIFSDTKKLSVTSWSPDSKNIAFIFENNVYLFDISNHEAKQLTSDGSKEIFYGKPDWVYEEEVFGNDIALWWSPNGKKLSFLKTNDTKVPEFTIPYYIQEGYEDYPEIRKIKYPKAGYPNPVVDLIVYDLSSNKLDLLYLDSDKIIVDNRLITEVVWVNDYLLVKVSNRASDLLEIFLVNTINNLSELIRSHVSTDSWFEITSNTLYIPKNESLGRKYDGYIDTIVDNGYNHLAYFSPPDNPNGISLSKGQWEVVDGVKSFDYNNNEVYFVSTLKSSIERHIHSVNLIESFDNLPVIKNISEGEGWYSGSFSSGSRYLLLNYEGPNVPYQKLIDLHSLKDIKTIESNKNLIENLENYSLPETKYKVITLTDRESGETFKANSMETLPLGFDPTYKYPVLFFVYGGPGSQLVNKNFAVGFSSVVAAELNAVVVTVDGRGTGFNNLNQELGSRFKFIVRDKLGHYEPLDQIAAAKLWSQRDYVDTDRIAIWGWSYGGFLTLKTLETDSMDHVFSYGVSIAPVTKWKLYDSIYTERYMRTPQENPLGYQTASIHNISNFRNIKKFFIGHGSGDDNVHVQNSLKLIDDFNLANIENFDFMIFPDSDHSIKYHNGNKIVYDRILDFLRRAFNSEFV